jgi:signal transduction histidine kinase
MEEGSGEVRELTSQFHDMADAIYNTQHWLESEIEKRTRQLTDAREMLEISLQHERDGRETQANLMALMAHEMRSPVAVIGNTAQMLNRLVQTSQPDLLPRIEKIMCSIRQLATLMDNFLTEKWLDMDRHGLNRQAGDLNQLCAEVSENFIESHFRPIRFEPCGGEARFCADWQLIRIAVINLLDNASKYSSLDDEIKLSVLPCDTDMLCVEVSDRGAGISPELQSHVFEKFARGRHETDIHGSGLGLCKASSPSGRSPSLRASAR